MKSVLVIVAAAALCGSAFADNGLVAEAKREAHQISSSARQDMHRIARADKFRQEQAAAQGHTGSRTHAMGAGSADTSMSSSRQARMDAAYANWQRSHR